MGGSTEKHQQDEASSTASFEDVGAGKSAKEKPSNTSKDLVVRSAGSRALDDGEVPDVLYVVQYRDVEGRLVDTKRSDKPIDVTRDGTDEEGAEKKPVLEIVTKVTSAKAKGRGKRRPMRACDDFFSDYSGSDTDSESDNDRDDDSDLVTIETTEMIIHSKHLRNALSAVVGYYPGTEFIRDRVVIDAPYRVLIHHRDALAQYRFRQPACHDAEYKEKTVQHINVALDFLDRTFSEKIRDEERRHQNAVPAATFEWYWMLFKPGEVVYAKLHNEWTPYVVSQVAAVETSDGKITQWTVMSWYLKYASGQIQRRMKSHIIRNFPGEQAIHSLPVIPSRFFPEDLEKQGGVTMQEKQIRLGKMYWELVKRPGYKEYEGLLTEKDDNGSTRKFTGRVIVDAEGFGRANLNNPDGFTRRPPMPPMRGAPPPPKDQLPQFAPRCSCKTCSGQAREETGPLANFEDLDPNRVEAAPRSDLYYWVCANDVPGFLLAERRWGHLNIDLLRDVRADREAFKYLVLDDEIKLTVRALIGKFASADGQVSPWPRDLVKNKGEGRIFLLHGSPGVGKTCTAECVAELTHRPLLSLTSGDISTDMSAASVERNLNYFLTLGERYGALVLLDEADVYLEERRPKDLHRNGLVSIFLRALEYYRGVLFLTTNRVEAFDAAFTSRIHVALHYRRLTDDDRLRIWNNNFERLERDSAGHVWVARSARDFALGGDGGDDVRALRWNGREIRNALQTAVALAETEALEDGCEKVSVTDAHLRAVVKMSKGFKDFLRRRRGWADEDEDSDDESEDEDGELSSMGDD